MPNSLPAPPERLECLGCSRFFAALVNDDYCRRCWSAVAAHRIAVANRDRLRRVKAQEERAAPRAWRMRIVMEQLLDRWDAEAKEKNSAEGGGNTG